MLSKVRESGLLKAMVGGKWLIINFLANKETEYWTATNVADGLSALVSRFALSQDPSTMVFFMS